MDKREELLRTYKRREKVSFSMIVFEDGTRQRILRFHLLQKGG